MESFFGIIFNDKDFVFSFGGVDVDVLKDGNGLLEIKEEIGGV